MFSPVYSQQAYVGRFAPSPSGSLHFGSLIAALASYLQARSLHGRWRMRIEDLDPPREQPGAAADILRTLEAYGFHWDGEVMYQGRRMPIYRDALRRLLNTGHAYYCECTRKQIDSGTRRGDAGAVYPGICRNRKLRAGSGRSLRVLTHDQAIIFKDRHLGHCQQRLESEVGDFIVCRSDGFIAYHLAVVIDDNAQGVTEVVRGADLLDSTPRQIHLQHLLQLPEPAYLHIPVAVDASGNKLSKQSFARPIPPRQPKPYLWAALKFLNQDPPRSLLDSDLDDLWDWAIEHWALGRIPKRRLAFADSCTHA